MENLKGGVTILMVMWPPMHSSHALSTVNAHKNKQQLVPILGTKPSVSALDPTTITRNNQKPQLQPITIATDSLADQNGVVTGVESKYSMPSNTFMALNEVFVLVCSIICWLLSYFPAMAVQIQAVWFPAQLCLCSVCFAGILVPATMCLHLHFLLLQSCALSG
ncbi:hypothetical protein LguiB_035878 [Lonicera macranthoides]